MQENETYEEMKKEGFTHPQDAKWKSVKERIRL